MSTLLALREFGVAFGERVVLASVTLDLPTHGMTVLMGPAGTGKSTLLRTLAGLNDAQPAMKTWGSATFDGHALGADRPALVIQNARLLTASVRENLVSNLPDRARLDRQAQDAVIGRLLDRCGLTELSGLLDRDAVSLAPSQQRRLAIARATASNPKMVMVDEPTAGLDDGGARAVLDLLRREAERRSVVFVTHHREHAQRAGGRVVLMAGGRVIESGENQAFFERPATEHGASFVRTGGCRVASPSASADELADGTAPPPPLPYSAEVPSRHVGPRGFYWLKPGRLGGLPRPGIVSGLSDDLDAIQELGITVLVSLEEMQTINGELLRARGLLTHHLPTADMGVPSVADATELCARVARWMADGQVVGIHCKAGLGRTGTLLACQLIYEGETPLTAIERVRQINPRWIQSDEQVRFLAEFGQAKRV